MAQKKTKTKQKDVKKLYKYRLLLETIEAMECNKPTLVDIHWCSNEITWLWKWKWITEEELSSLCQRMINIMEMQNSLREIRRKETKW